MLFNSWVFALFALVVIPLYWCLPFRKQNILILLASYFFYSCWDYRFLTLLLASTIIDFYLGRRMSQIEDPKARKRLLVFSCTFNLTVLGIFKYYNFFVGSAISLLTPLGFHPLWARLDVVLPIGISFYTFQSMSYVIDVYRRKIQPVDRLYDFAMFVAYFPHLVAGPIVRPEKLIPQLVRPRTMTPSKAVEGAWLILWGLFKKVVVADSLALVVDSTFSAPSPTGLECLLAIYCFAFQIYGDFSGYSDIARGVSKLMGIELSLNFNLPYISKSPQEFWHRWHISLSTWLRDYLYVPLGGSRGGRFQTYRNLMITMLLGGLWHGAGWTFILWGFYHGFLLAVNRLMTEVRSVVSNRRHFLVEALQIIVMFHVTCLGWLIFRADSIGQVFTFLRQIVTDLKPDPQVAVLAIALIVFAGALIVFEAWLKNCDNPTTRPGWRLGLGPLAVSTLVWALMMISPPTGKAFIYFQF